MLIDLTSGQRDLLLQLVDAALRDIGPEIRHTTTSSYKDDLKAHRRELQRLRQLLAAEAPAAAGSADLVGTP